MRKQVARLVSSTLLAGLFGVFAGAGTARAGGESPVAQVAVAMLELEEAIKWEAVSDAWRGEREAWMASMRAARTPQDLARGVLALENAMTWESVSENFRGRRDAWGGELRRASSVAQVARLLIELEGVTRWEACDDSWRGTRPAWVAKLQALSR